MYYVVEVYNLFIFMDKILIYGIYLIFWYFWYVIFIYVMYEL